MPRYSWKGIRTDGSPCAGTQEASTPQELSEQLLKDRIAMLEATSTDKQKCAFFNKKITMHDKTIFFEYLAFMLDSGVQIVPALSVSLKLPLQATFHTTTRALIHDIEQGKNFSQALTAHPHIFPPNNVYLVTNAEKTGKLSLVCKHLAEQYKQHDERNQQIKAALLMPSITLGIALLLISGIFIFIMPQFQALYASTGKTLPPITQYIFKIGDFLRSGYMLGFIAGVIAISITIKISLKNRYKKYIDYLVVFIYPLYPLPLEKERIVFLEELTLFLTSGVPLAQALEHVEKTTNNTIFQEKIKIMHNAILEGKTLAHAMQDVGKPFFDEQLIALLSVGHISGNIALILERTAQAYAKQMSKKIYKSISFLPIILIILTGLIIGIMMLAIYLPIFNFGSLLGA